MFVCLFVVLLFVVATDDDQEGVLDGLMEALQTGSAFRDPSRPARKKAGGRKGAACNHRGEFQPISPELFGVDLLTSGVTSV